MDIHFIFKTLRQDDRFEYKNDQLSLYRYDSLRRTETLWARFSREALNKTAEGFGDVLAELANTTTLDNGLNTKMDRYVATYAYYTDPTIVEMNGESIYGHDRRYGFLKLDTLVSFRAPDKVQIKAYTHVLNQTANGLWYSNGEGWATCYVNEDDLNTDYPDWQARYDIAKSLELDYRQALAYVFGEVIPSPKVDITGVTF